MPKWVFNFLLGTVIFFGLICSSNPLSMIFFTILFGGFIAYQIRHQDVPGIGLMMSVMLFFGDVQTNMNGVYEYVGLPVIDSGIVMKVEFFAAVALITAMIWLVAKGLDKMFLQPTQSR